MLISASFQRSQTGTPSTHTQNRTRLRQREDVTPEIKIQLDRRTQKRQKKMRQGQGLARILEQADETPTSTVQALDSKSRQIPQHSNRKFSGKIEFRIVLGEAEIMQKHLRSLSLIFCGSQLLGSGFQYNIYPF